MNFLLTLSFGFFLKPVLHLAAVKFRSLFRTTLHYKLLFTDFWKRSKDSKELKEPVFVRWKENNRLQECPLLSLAKTYAQKYKYLVFSNWISAAGSRSALPLADRDTLTCHCSHLRNSNSSILIDSVYKHKDREWRELFKSYSYPCTNKELTQ